MEAAFRSEDYRRSIHLLIAPGYENDLKFSFVFLKSSPDFVKMFPTWV
jgi:hypothetical protein